MNSQSLRVLVTGAGGQLGQALCRSAPAGYQVQGLTRADCDIGDASAVAEVLDRFQAENHTHTHTHTHAHAHAQDANPPALLINAAAYTAVDRAEVDREAAFAANADAPGLLAAACAERGIRFFHVSTDFVFDGLQSHPYATDALPSPQSVYGESKLAGEQAVLAADTNSLVLRTGWVYAAAGGNFMLTMLRLHRERDAIAVVADQVGTPTSADSLAAALWAAAQSPDLRGIYHWSDAGVCSWYDFAVAIGEEAQALDLVDAPAQVRPITTADYPTAARRPAYSVLDKSRSWADFSMPPIHWRAQLRRVLAQLRSPAQSPKSPQSAQG